MSNARARDVHAGWEVYKASYYAAELEAINRDLDRRGLSPISARTYNHFRKLRRYGYERYVPINQLDVETLRDPALDSGLRSRYRSRSTLSSAQIVFLLGDPLILSATMVQASEADVGLIIQDHDLIQPARSALVEGTNVLLAIGLDARARMGEIELVESESDKHYVRVGLRRVLSPLAALSLEPLAPTVATFRLDTLDSDLLVNSIRTLNMLFVALDSARIVCEEAIEVLGGDSHHVLYPPTLRRLEKTNPAVVELGLSDPALWVFMLAISAGLGLRIKWHKGTGAKNEARIPAAVAHSIDAKAAIDEGRADILREIARTQRLQNDRRAARVRWEGNELPAQVLGIVQRYISSDAELTEDQEDDDVGPDIERLENLIENHLGPSIENLFDESFLELLVETEGDTPREVEDTEVQDDED